MHIFLRKGARKPWIFPRGIPAYWFSMALAALISWADGEPITILLLSTYLHLKKPGISMQRTDMGECMAIEVIDGTIVKLLIWQSNMWRYLLCYFVAICVPLLNEREIGVLHWHVPGTL